MKRNPVTAASVQRPNADNWYFEELMTAQPEATREFFRGRLRSAQDEARRPPEPKSGSKSESKTEPKAAPKPFGAKL